MPPFFPPLQLQSMFHINGQRFFQHDVNVLFSTQLPAMRR